MKKQSSPNLYELNLPPTLPDLRGKVPVTMSAESVLARFKLSRDFLPKEVTVLDPIALDAYPESAKYEVFVSPDGDDNAEGTKDTPLATAQEAFKRVEGKGGATVTFRGGTYPLTEEVRLTSAHSGKANSPLIVRSYEGERAKFTSNTPISTAKEKWRIADPATDPVAARLPKEAQGKVLCTALSDHGLTSADIPEIRNKRVGPPSLYVGGEEYTLARYPNKKSTIQELLYFDWAYDTGRVTVRDGSDLYWTWVERAKREFDGDIERDIGWQIRMLNGKDNFDEIPDSPLADKTAEERAQFLLSWVNTGNIWYYGSTFEGWEFGYYNLADKTEGKDFSHYAESDTEEKTPLLGAFVPDENGPYTYRGQKGYYSLKSKTGNCWGCKFSSNSPAGHNTFYLFNAIEALDEPGEWFFDKETGVLYIYPKDENAFFGTEIGCSNKDEFAPFSCEGLEYAIFDGIEIDGSGECGFSLEACYNTVLQHVKVSNTKKDNVKLKDCVRTAIIYSDFSAAYTVMIAMDDNKSCKSFIPAFNVIQNCFFHDAKPTRQLALLMSGCRTVVSHNYFRNTCMDSNTTEECIVEYNRFEGGSADVVDGGMYYASGSAVRCAHVRYNLFHMFNETHQAIYNDTMAGSCYAYYNVISTLNSKCNRHKGWYSSTGLGNICFGNIMVLRDPWEVARAGSNAGDEDDVIVVGSGDNNNQSPLFYYYFGDEHAASNKRRYDFVKEGREELYKMDYDPNSPILAASQSLAGHWWGGMKEGEVKRFLDNPNRAEHERTDPTYINHLWGTRLVLDALENSDYRVKYFYFPARLTGKTYTCKIMKPGVEILIPAYTYLDDNYNEVRTEDRTVIVPEDGRITLTYEEIGSMERLRRAPAYCVLQNNIMLGGTPLMDENQNIIGDVDEANMINDGALFDWFPSRDGDHVYAPKLGYTPTTLSDHNFLRYDYNSVMEDPRSYNYTFRREILDEIASTLEEAEHEAVLSLDPYKTGPTYGFDYKALGPVQKYLI